ncbi:MAG TPA: helix-hairpin-helix domain-containing protein, partial [Chloroflexi bacterium]|nr:helix-hairpin-helix domain-containing protein [Chloroflexota bacterium]
MNNHKVDLNTASVEELTELPGIGPALAKRIIQYRETVHPFEEPVEITAVPGISERMYQAIASLLTVTPPQSPPAPTTPLASPTEAPPPEETVEAAPPPEEPPPEAPEPPSPEKPPEEKPSPPAPPLQRKPPP